jgi:transcriptional regulator with XRE-family HTH domain
MKNPFAERLDRNVRRLVKQRAWTLEKVALEAGLSRSHFFYILTGQRTPSMVTLKKVSDAFKVDVSELWRK